MTSENHPAAAMDSLLQAIKVNIIPNQEYLLQGSILDTQVQRLLHRWVKKIKILLINFCTIFEQYLTD